MKKKNSVVGNIVVTGLEPAGEHTPPFPELINAVPSQPAIPDYPRTKDIKVVPFVSKTKKGG